MNDYIVSVLSLEMKKIATAQQNGLSFAKKINLIYNANIDTKEEVVYYTNALSPQKKEITYEQALTNLLENGADLLHVYSGENIVLYDLMISTIISNQFKEELIKKVEDKLSKIDPNIMNNFFIKIGSHNSLFKANKSWIDTKELLIKKGLTFYQGEDLNSLEFKLIEEMVEVKNSYYNLNKNSLKIPEGLLFIIKNAKDFDFQKKYKNNKFEEITMLEYVEKLYDTYNRSEPLKAFKMFLEKNKLDKELKEKPSFKTRSPKI